MKIAAVPLAALASTLALAACSAPPEREPAADATESAAAITDDSALASAGPAAQPPASGDQGAGVLTLEGLGGLAIGKPVPAGGSFAERGGQISEECRLVSSPEHPGVYAITRGKGGPVRRITLGEGAKAKLAEGIGVGASEAAVRAAFPGFAQTPHKYAAAPAKYLTQPGDEPRLRFEIGEDGRVSAIHAGLMPELAYVEGCA